MNHVDHHSPTPAEMEILLQFVCMVNGSVLACEGYGDLVWWAIPAAAWHEKYRPDERTA